VASGVAGPLASGWRARGERLASGWRAAGGPVASGWRAAGVASGWRAAGERLNNRNIRNIVNSGENIA
jgi:hypothetical protein